MVQSLCTLPHEILSHITSYFDQSFDKTDLRNVSLTSHALHNASRHWLFRYITIVLHSCHDEGMPKTAVRLLHLTTLPIKILSIHFNTRGSPHECLLPLLLPVLRFFINSSSVALQNLILGFQSPGWNSTILQSLVGAAEKVKRITLDECNTRTITVSWLNKLLTLCPACTEIDYEYFTRFHPENAPNDDSIQSLPGYHLFAANPNQKIKTLRVGSDALPGCLSGLFQTSFLSSLESISLDPGLIGAFYSLFQAASKQDIALQRFYVNTDTLSERFWEGVMLGECDPRCRIPSLLNHFPYLLLADFHIGFYNEDNERTFTFTDLPSGLQSLSISVRNDYSAGTEHITECLESLEGWLQNCQDLKSCVIALHVDWTEESLVHADCFKVADYLDDDDLQEWKEQRPEDWLRYAEIPKATEEEDPDPALVPDDIWFRLCNTSFRNMVQNCYELVEDTRTALEKKGILFSLNELKIYQGEILERPGPSQRFYQIPGQSLITSYFAPLPKVSQSVQPGGQDDSGIFELAAVDNTGDA